MRSFEDAAKKLMSGDKADKIKELSNSREARNIERMLDMERMERALAGGDEAALADMLRRVLSTEDGQKLARQVRGAVEKQNGGK